MADRRYREAEFLREHYVERRLSTYEVADLCGTTHATVLRWLGRHGFETRAPNRESPIPSFSTHPTLGYERVRVSEDGERHEVYVHRLAAVAWFGLDAVRGREVHHVSNVPWDTRESNVEVLSKAEHSRRTRSAAR